MPTANPSDEKLVTACRAGNREAFRQIVERYKTLVCSVTYCATGNVTQSEDLAQETFITAWKNLSLLREPEKLRGWLCGIARNRTQKHWTRAGREPSYAAVPIEDAPDTPSPDALPSEQTISSDEEAIMWRTLATIPEIYREPLVLFYRQHQSIENVAAALDLSEDVVKQRLSRGRKLLHEKVQAFVEGALQRSIPGREFAGTVLAGLPLGAFSPAGTAAAKATATQTGFLSVWLAPIVGALSGLAAESIAINAVTSDRAQRNRRIRHVAASLVFIMGIGVGGEFAVESLARRLAWSDRASFIATAIFWWLYGCTLITWVVASVQRHPALRREPSLPNEIKPPAMRPAKHVAMVACVYLSLASWLIGLSWRAHDQFAILLIAATLPGLGLWHCIRTLRGNAANVIRNHLVHFALAAGALIVIFNLRFPGWVAGAHGISEMELRQLRPMWLLPVLTLAFLLWTAVVVALTTSRRGSNEKSGAE